MLINDVGFKIIADNKIEVWYSISHTSIPEMRDNYMFSIEVYAAAVVRGICSRDNRKTVQISFIFGSRIDGPGP